MNTLILNRKTFEMPVDGWYQVAPLGEFPHAQAGVMQVVDAAACEAMANAFREQAAQQNFAGLLIDFDHFSLDEKLKSEAAGWITDVEFRNGGSPASSPSGTTPRQSPAGAGLWAKIRWSDVGEQCVKGGRYRFISPVWAQRDCEDLGDGRLRPIRLLNAAVTNDPNLKGMVPLSNRDQRSEAEGPAGEIAAKRRKGAQEEKSGQDSQDGRDDDLLPNAAGGDPGERLRWELGESPDDRHCPSCEALAGQVHTRADWDASGLAPGDGALYCQRHCHCALVATTDAESGDLSTVPQRVPAAVIAARSHHDGALANIGWTDEARAASLAVRRAKAAARAAARERAYVLDRTRGVAEAYRRHAEEAFRREHGRSPTTAAEIAEAEELAEVPEPFRTRGEMTPEELAEGIVTRSDPERTDPYEDDLLGWFEDEGMGAMSPEAIDGLIAEIREKLARDEALTATERGFVEELRRRGHAGASDEDAPLERLETDSGSPSSEGTDEGTEEEIRRRAEGLMEREAAGEALPEAEKEFLRRYRETVGNRSTNLLANIGWTDEARAASLAVRRAKAAARKAARDAGEEGGERDAGEDADEEEPWADDELGWFEDEGLGAMSREAVEKLTEKIRHKLAAGEGLEPAEAAFLRERADSGYAGKSDGDPVFMWMEHDSMGAPTPGDGDTYWTGGSPYFDETTGEYVYPEHEAFPEDPRVLPHPGVAHPEPEEPLYEFWDEHGSPRLDIDEEKRRLHELMFRRR